MSFKRYLSLSLVCTVLAACASSGDRAPVYERAEAEKRDAALAKQSQRQRDWRPKSYVVQKGDTLYSIAFNYGFDYHELAELNGIKDPRVIAIGQEIRLFPGGTPGTLSAAVNSLIKEQPKLVKYPYSDAALAQIEKVQEQTFPVVLSSAAPELTPAVPEAIPSAAADDIVYESEDPALQWTMPTQGKLIAQFSESDNRKGVDVAGKLGQPIVAVESGKVVYSGSGLRGYGKLIIIKHNKTYLSAYAHNDKLLVKEGQSVTRGQNIAAMGKTDTDQVKLHFEVRRYGKPVDPEKYLPFGKS